MTHAARRPAAASPLRSVAVLMFALAAPGCGAEGGARPGAASGDDPESVAPVVTRVDSAGMQVVTSSNLPPLEWLGWAVEAEPSVVIGHLDDPERSVFQVGGAQLASGGPVVVADGGLRQLVAFDDLGNPVARFGRQGEGPGEFEGIALVAAPQTDSLVVWDSRQRRLHVVAPDLSGFRVVVPEGRLTARAPLGFTGGRLLLESSVLTPFHDGPNVAPQTFRWFDPATGASTELLEVSIARFYSLSGSGRPRISALIPFVPTPAATAGDGVAFLLEGGAPEIRVVDLNGVSVQLLRVPGLAGRAVDAAMIEAHRLEEFPDGGSAVVDELYAEMRIPETLPALDTLVMDDGGHLWARSAVGPAVPGTPEAAIVHWVVFDPTGAALGTLGLPRGLRVTEIGPDYLLGVEVDALGVEWVVRRGLTRGVGAAP